MLNILINEEGWRSIGDSMPPDEIAERMGMPMEAVECVLTGEKHPDTMFIAASLTSFPVMFHDLFEVITKHA